MLFLLGLFMVCFSQVGFAGDRAVAGVSEEVLHQRAVLRRLDNDSVDLESQSEQDKSPQSMIRGLITTTAALGAGGVGSILGYCIWQDPKIVIAPLLGLAITGAVAVVNLSGVLS